MFETHERPWDDTRDKYDCSLDCIMLRCVRYSVLSYIQTYKSVHIGPHYEGDNLCPYLNALFIYTLI